MKSTYLLIMTMFPVASLVGCSGSDIEQVADSTSVAPFAATAIAPAPAITPQTQQQIQAPIAETTEPTSGDAVEAIEPFRNPFAPPKELPPEPEPEPEPEPVFEPEPALEPKSQDPPSIRLVGFMNVGEPKVLVSFQEELRMLAIGDTLEEMKVARIDSPEVTMLFDDREIKINMFEQAWQHEGSESTNSYSSRPLVRSRPPRNTPPSVSNTPSSSPTPNVSGIPGFGPNEGQAPESSPPVDSGFGTGGVGEMPELPGVGGNVEDTEGLPGLQSAEVDGASFRPAVLPEVPDGF